MTIVAPSLSTKGWITAPAEKCDQLIAHMFAADVNQSYLYNGNICSLQGLFQRYGKDIDGAKQELRAQTERYLGRYYDQVAVDVNDDTAVNLSNRITLYLSVTVYENGQEYIAANLISFIDSKFEKIAKLNNTGSIT